MVERTQAIHEYTFYKNKETKNEQATPSPEAKIKQTPM